MNFNIDINKQYNCDAKTLFQAIGQGILFKYTGALMDKLKMDFREGGELFIDWGDSQMKGKFTAVQPFEKIAFTWNFMADDLKKEMNTLVTITIKESGGKSTLNLLHEGIGSEKQKADMTFGWTDAVEDLAKTHFKMD
jgi:uncharacterized protein YndB with AHSA1/START domain